MERRRRTHGSAVDRPNRMITNAQTQTNTKQTCWMIRSLDQRWERILLRADESMDLAQGDD